MNRVYFNEFKDMKVYKYHIFSCIFLLAPWSVKILCFLFKICNATSQEELDRVIGEDDERFIDNCGWPRTDMVTVRNQYI